MEKNLPLLILTLLLFSCKYTEPIAVKQVHKAYTKYPKVLEPYICWNDYIVKAGDTITDWTDIMDKPWVEETPKVDTQYLDNGMMIITRTITKNKVVHHYNTLTKSITDTALVNKLILSNLKAEAVNDATQKRVRDWQYATGISVILVVLFALVIGYIIRFKLF